MPTDFTHKPGEDISQRQSEFSPGQDITAQTELHGIYAEYGKEGKPIRYVCVNEVCPPSTVEGGYYIAVSVLQDFKEPKHAPEP